MDINLGRKDNIIKDRDIKKKFEEFSNGFFDDISMQLYESDGKYFLNLAPYSDKILSNNMCITASNKRELESVIEDLSCNIGIMLAEKSGKIQNTRINEQTVQIDGKEVSLLNFEQVYVEGKNENTELYKADELTEKIKSISSKVFGSEKDFDMSSYVKNTMFARINGKHTLEKEDFELLKYYKEEGYEFLNSFLGNGQLKTRGNIEKEHIGKEFIDNLYEIDKLFEKFPTLDESITVYRGETTRNPLDNIEYNSFISTSLDRSVAENNFSKGRLYQINLPKGTHYIPMDAINGFEGMYGESEAEILLRPSSLKIKNKEVEGDTEVLSVTAKEKGDFSEIIRKSLENRKEELIKKGLCDEKEFKEILDYLNEKHKEEMINKAKVNENKYKTYRMETMKKITDTRRKIDEIRENNPNSEMEKAEKSLRESELVQEYNSLINSAKRYDLTLKDIKLLVQNLEGKIDKFERNKGTQEIKQSREKLDKQSDVIYSRDEVSKLKNAVEMYRLQGNQEKVDEFSIKLESEQRQYEYVKKELGMDKEHEKENIGKSGYSIEENEKKFIEKQQQVLTDYSGKEIGNRIIEEQFEKETGKRTITTNGELINEDGEYKLSEISEGIGTDLEKQRKEMIIANKITNEKEEHIYQKDNNGKEMYYKLVDGKLAFKITKNNRGTTIENFDKGQIKDVFEYDEEGKALISMGEIEHIDENYVEYFFDSQVPYFEAENREITNNKSSINTQKLGKETVNEMSDTILMDETQRDINEQVRNLYKEKQSQEL